jgi:hypothetical protein
LGIARAALPQLRRIDADEAETLAIAGNRVSVNRCEEARKPFLIHAIQPCGDQRSQHQNQNGNDTVLQQPEGVRLTFVSCKNKPFSEMANKSFNGSIFLRFCH